MVDYSLSLSLSLSPSRSLYLSIYTYIYIAGAYMDVVVALKKARSTCIQYLYIYRY